MLSGHTLAQLLGNDDASSWWNEATGLELEPNPCNDGVAALLLDFKESDPTVCADVTSCRILLMRAVWWRLRPLFLSLSLPAWEARDRGRSCALALFLSLSLSSSFGLEGQVTPPGSHPCLSLEQPRPWKAAHFLQRGGLREHLKVKLVQSTTNSPNDYVHAHMLLSGTRACRPRHRSCTACRMP